MMASGAVAALTVITAIVGAVKQYYRELDQSTANAAQSYAQTNSGIESQISEITRLKTALNEGSLSEQEAYNAKSQLYDIQKNLASSYGEQAQGIDLVNGKLEEQTALIRKNIQAEDASRYLNENDKGINRAIKKMEQEDRYRLGEIDYKSVDEKQRAALQKIIDKYDGAIQTMMWDGSVVTGYKSVEQLIKNGWVTDDSVTSYLDLMLGDNWQSEFGNAQKAFAGLKTKIDGTNHSLKDYLTTDAKGNLTSRGVWKFADDLVKIFGGDGSGIASKDANGLYELNLTGDNLQTVADRLGTTTEMVELFGKALSEAGMNVHFEPIANQIKNLEKQAKDLKDQIANSTDDEETTKLMSELNEVNNKTIKKKIIAQVEGGQSVSDLLAMDDATLSATLDIDVGDAEKAREIIEEIGQASGEVPINVKIDEGQFQQVLGSMTGTVEVTPEVEGQPEVEGTTVDVTPNVTEQPKFTPQTVNVSSGGVNSSGVKDVTVSGKLNLKLGSYPRTAPAISGTANYKGNFSGIGSPPVLSGTVNYSAKFSGTVSGSTPVNGSGGGHTTIDDGGTRYSGTMLNVARADGTAYNVLNYQRLSPSHAGGKVALERNEYALTNEVGKLLANYKSI